MRESAVFISSEMWCPEHRPTEVYDAPCGPCPSMKGDDPETLDIMTWPLEQRMTMTFRCAWRREKLCKGNYDKMVRGSKV